MRIACTCTFVYVYSVCVHAASAAQQEKATYICMYVCMSSKAKNMINYIALLRFRCFQYFNNLNMYMYIYPKCNI